MQRAPEARFYQLLGLQLVTDAAKQLCLAERLGDHHEVVGIEVLVQQVEAEAIGQYQLAELLQLVRVVKGAVCTKGTFFSLTLTVLMTKSSSICTSPS